MLLTSLGLLYAHLQLRMAMGKRLASVRRLFLRVLLRFPIVLEAFAKSASFQIAIPGKERTGIFPAARDFRTPRPQRGVSHAANFFGAE
jgi:hypothetical protein